MQSKQSALRDIFKFVFVGTGTGIKSVGPAFRYQLYQIVITFQVLCKDNQVITALVDSSPTNRKAIDLVDDGSTYFPRCGILVGKPATGYVHFTPEYRFEYFGFEFCLFFLQGGQFFFFVFCLFRAAFDGFDSFLYTFNGIFCRSVFLFTRLKNSFIPNILPWSVNAKPFIPSRIALSTNAGIEA